MYAIRNTPTGVGKTRKSFPKCEEDINADDIVAGKHPHGRGEDSRYGPVPGCYPETPPRAWGRPSTTQPRPLCAGNTPTGVGKTDTQALPTRLA